MVTHANGLFSFTVKPLSYYSALCIFPGLYFTALFTEDLIWLNLHFICRYDLLELYNKILTFVYLKPKPESSADVKINTGV